MLKDYLSRSIGPGREERAEALRRADDARDRKEPAAAAILYRRVLDRWGSEFGLLVQMGNALKDSGASAEAERAYRTALSIQPLDADCHLQLGHLMKVSGQPARAEEYYWEAHRLDPGLPGPRHELKLQEDAPAVLSTALAFAPDSLPQSYATGPDKSARTALIHHRLMDSLRWRRN